MWWSCIWGVHSQAVVFTAMRDGRSAGERAAEVKGRTDAGAARGRTRRRKKVMTREYEE